ncbi:F-box only protein 5 [Melanotaenia boesemani]|uniref:F-box only protein 5 n=1 Tax=Melanotaenia boesemani TaxID=1250792 RepID=UPI001C05C321|nr:F-box only protein 5 [Melanotaenia boesemani]
MKCPFYEAAMDNGKDKSIAAAESKVLQLKPSPVKEPTPIKPQLPSARSTTVLFSIKDNTRAVHNKENTASRDHEGTLDEGFEDSGYLSLHNSQIDDHHVDEENEQVLEKPTAVLSNTAVTRQEKTVLFPSKCQGRTKSSQPVSLSVSSLVEKRTVVLSSTPSTQHSSTTNLPVLKFQQAVCDELAKSYKKNKRYDWSIVSKVAEDHLLDRVIGGQMGLEYVDMLASLLSRNMRSILIKTLSLLGDMDLISCKKVSRTWRRIICEDTAALRRCQQAEEALRESRNSLRQRASGLTRDVAVSRVVFSCMQTLASSSSSPSSSAQNGGINRRTVPSHKGSAPNTRFNEYMQAARNLKQHQSLRSCKRCGSPATHLPEVQRATCSSCLFDFCTRCQEPFHASTPCRTVQPRSNFSSSKTTSVTPGSTRSRRSLRRL